MNYLDDLLNWVTMYRLVLYYLLALLAAAFMLCLFGVLPYSPWTLLGSIVWVTAVAWVANYLLARYFHVVANVESVYITALILALIITPQATTENFLFLGWAAALAMASKYVLSIHRKHLFNPVAVAVAITAFGSQQSASWWVGTSSLLPIVVIGGILIVRKVHRADLALSFLGASLLTTALFGVVGGATVPVLLKHLLTDSSLFFFACIMLTEPLTTPPTRWLQVVYGALVGFLFAPQVHVASFYFTPELALLAGNVFSYVVSPKFRLLLTLERVEKIGDNLYDFVFRPDRKLRFQPGQYLEWTLGVPKPDDRGNRRYFTIASSPTEDTVRMGVKFYEPASRFKSVLGTMKPGDTMIASQLSGDFTLPSDPSQKLALIAGGIGITPFRSMIKNLVDSNQSRDLKLIYSNRHAEDVAYTEVFNEAQKKLGIPTVYALTDIEKVPAGWPGHVGAVNEELIRQELPDFKERMFYLSGPHAMVVTFEGLLKGMGVPPRQIRCDYFPGFA